nr:hypothetical protein [Lachnospiraceae bacterium]
MDNFMDKLAKRFNAGELIQANGEAEARENQRLREQMSEYDKVIQEIRRLNLKTIEVSEQVSQMAACSIEQIESYEPGAAVLDNSEAIDELKESLGLIRENLFSMEQRIIQACAQQESYDNQDEFISLSRKVDENADAVSRKMGESAEEIKKQFEDAIYRLEASIRQMETSFGQIEASVSRVELGNDTNQRMVEGSIRNLEQMLAEKLDKPSDDGEMLAAINAVLSEQAQAQQESAKQIKEMIVNVRLYMDDVQKHIEDYVHREDVKVYRNVQAAVGEQLSIKARDMNDHMDQIEKELQKNKGVKTMVILAVLFSGASLLIQVLQMLGIL